MNLQKKFTPSFHITNLIISAKRTVGLNLCLFYNLCFPLYSQNIRSFQNVRMPKVSVEFSSTLEFTFLS